MRLGYYVLHVKRGFENREKSILYQFDRLNTPFEWVLDHDKEQITPDLLETYKFKGDINIEAISCSLKHIRAWERIADNDDDGAFVFEDDVIIDLKKFKKVSRAALDEYHAKCPGCGYISLGSGCALYVPWTKRRKGQWLYPANFVRATDSYWINRETAKKMVAWIRENGFDRPADHLIDQIVLELNIPVFWLEPTLVNQGSHTGLFPSSIQRLERGKLLDRLEWKLKIFRRKYLYPLIGKDLRENG